MPMQYECFALVWCKELIYHALIAHGTIQNLEASFSKLNAQDVDK